MEAVRNSVERRDTGHRWSAGALYLELKRRGVLEAGTNYTVVAWLVAQVAELIGEIFVLPAWALQALVIALAVGLPVSLFLSWVFELTPRGLKLESEITRAEAAARTRGRAYVCGLIAILVLTIGALAVRNAPAVCPMPTQAESNTTETPEISEIELYFGQDSTRLMENAPRRIAVPSDKVAL